MQAVKLKCKAKAPASPGGGSISDPGPQNREAIAALKSFKEMLRRHSHAVVPGSVSFAKPDRIK